MKRIMCGAAALLLALLLCGQALAAGSAEPVRTFVYEDTLYTYVKLEGIDSPITQVEAKIGAQSFPASSRLETVRQAGFPITYLLLVDNSNSMPPFRAQLEEFCRELAAGSGENTRFILATLGDQFQVVNDNVPAERIGEQLAAVPLDETVTRLHTCMDSALDYFETLPRQGTELRSMVVITDGVQYDPLGGVPYEALLERITHSDVMLHSLGTGTDSEALDSLGKLTESSGGIHQVLTGGLTAATAAKTLTDTAGELMVTGFDLDGRAAAGENQEVSFTFASSGTLLCRGEAAVDIPDPAGSETAAAGTSAEESESPTGENEGPSAEESESPAGENEGPSAQDVTEPSSEEETQGTQEASPSTANPGSGTGDGQGMQAGGNTAAAKEKESGGLWIAGGAAAVLAAAAAAGLFVRNRGKKGRAESRVNFGQEEEKRDSKSSLGETSGAGEAPSGIYMRLDAPEGMLASGRTEYILCGELTVGRSAECDIALLEETVPAQAARIFLGDGRVCLEALSAQTEVLVNGRPVKGTCPLRSGDRISIAGCTLRLLF